MIHWLIPLLLFALLAVSPALADLSGLGPSVNFSHGALRVSDNKRFLVHEDGTPFFWLGDTAWLVIRKYTREDTEKQPSVLEYLKSRAGQGFNAIQCQLACDAETTDAYEHEAFVDGHFDQPRIVEGPENDYWDTANWFIAQAKTHGLYLALLPTWFNAGPDRSVGISMVSVRIAIQGRCTIASSLADLCGRPGHGLRIRCQDRRNALQLDVIILNHALGGFAQLEPPDLGARGRGALEQKLAPLDVVLLADPLACRIVDSGFHAFTFAPATDTNPELLHARRHAEIHVSGCA